MNWSEGYFTGVDYTHGYYNQLNPGLLRLAVAAGGFETPSHEGFNYLELGFGQGISIGMHAAANGGTYWGTDFNPAHAATAMELAAASGARAHLFDDSFKEFATRTDLPDFDYITLHGIWSWVSEENRDVIVDLIRRKLKTGGIVYISYNIHPGWAPRIPIRQLMSLFTEKVGTLTGSDAAISGALHFAKDVLAAGADFYRDVPAMARHLETLNNHNNNYIAHEYLNADWKVSTFSETANHLEQAKLTYAGPTRLLDSIEALRFTPDGQKILQRIGDPVLRETTKDFLTNGTFRCDVFVKGPRRIARGEFNSRWKDQAFVLTSHKSNIPPEIKLPFGKIPLNENIPGDVVTVMAANDYLPMTIAQLEAHPKLTYAGTEKLIETMILLVGAGQASTAQIPTDDIIKRCMALNRYLCDRALASREIECLASPVTGGAIEVPHVCMLFINAMSQGRDTVADMSMYVWEFLESIGERMHADDKPIESRAENLATIEPLARRFLATTLPIFKALQVV